MGLLSNDRWRGSFGVTEPGRLELPRKNNELEKFALQCSNIAKMLEEDDFSGSKVYRYKKLDADHYRHALNYLLLASDRCGVISDQNAIARFFKKRRRRTWMSA